MPVDALMYMVMAREETLIRDRQSGIPLATVLPDEKIFLGQWNAEEEMRGVLSQELVVGYQGQQDTVAQLLSMGIFRPGSKVTFDEIQSILYPC